LELTAGKSILEHLFEAQELQNGQVDSRMQTEPALVGAQHRVELDTVALIDLALALVVLPSDAELDDSLGDGSDLESLPVFRVLFEKGRVLEGGGKLCGLISDCLATIDTLTTTTASRRKSDGGGAASADVGRGLREKLTLVSLLELWFKSHCGVVEKDVWV
jgi:hypothetical protein